MQEETTQPATEAADNAVTDAVDAPSDVETSASEEGLIDAIQDPDEFLDKSIENFFDADKETETQSQTKQADEPVKEQEVEPTEEPEKEPSKEEEETDVDEEPEKDDKSKEDEQPDTDEEEKEDDSVEKVFEESEILTPEQIEEKYPRSQKAVRNLAKEYSEKAQKYQDVVADIGGEDLLEPAKAAWTSIKEGNNDDLVVNIATTSGIERLPALFGTAVSKSLALMGDEVDGQPLQDNPNLAYLAKETRKYLDHEFSQHFGKGVTYDKVKASLEGETLSEETLEDTMYDRYEVEIEDVDTLVNAHKAGLIDLDQFTDKDLSLPPAMSKMKDDLATANKKIESLTTQNQQRTTQETAANQAKFTESYQADLKKDLEPVLSRPAFQKQDSDAPEVQGVKELLAEALLMQAEAAFRKTEEFGEFQKNFQSMTPVQKSKYKQAVQNANKTLKDRAIATEQVISLLYANSRNAQVSKRLNGNQQAGEVKTPTQTMQSKPQSSSMAEMSDEEADAYMDQQIEAALSVEKSKGTSLPAFTR